MQAIRSLLELSVKGEITCKDGKPLYIFFRINGKAYEMKDVQSFRKDVLIQLLEKYNALDIIKSYTLTFTVDFDKGYLTLDDGTFFKISYDINGINEIKMIESLQDSKQQQILRDLVIQFFDRPNRYFMSYKKSNGITSDEVVLECKEFIDDPTIDSYTFDDQIVVSISEDSGKSLKRTARGFLTLLGVGTAIIGAGCVFAISYMRRHRT